MSGLLPLGVFLMIGLVIGFVALMVYVIAAENRRQRENLEAARARYGGRLEESFWKGPAILFEVDGVPAKFSYFRGTDKAPPWTKVHFDWAPPGKLRVAPEGGWASLKKFFGAQDIQVGDPSFDEAFLIQGGPEEWVREVLGRENRRRLMALRALGATFWRGDGRVSLDVTPAGIILHCCRNHVRERSQLMTFIEESVALLRALKGFSGQAVSVSIREVVDAGRCPVCGDAPEARPKRCDNCQTAYHAECWSYLGGCAIFGCSEQYRPRRREGHGKEW